MSESQSENFYRDYISLLSEQLDAKFSLTFVAISMLIFMFMLVITTIIAEKKKFNAEFKELPDALYDMLHTNVGSVTKGFKFGMTFGSTCVRLNRKEIYLNYDDLYNALKDKEFSQNLILHELIHSKAWDPAYIFLLKATFLMMWVPLLFFCLMFGGSLIIILEEIVFQNGTLIGSFLIILWLGFSVLAIFKLLHKYLHIFENAKEDFANQQLKEADNKVLHLILVGASLTSVTFSITAFPSNILIIIVFMMYGALMLSNQCHISFFWYPFLVAPILIVAIWTVTAKLNYARILVLKNPSDFTFELPSWVEIAKYSDWSMYLFIILLIISGVKKCVR